mgnify:CR=1 FL=1
MNIGKLSHFAKFQIGSPLNGKIDKLNSIIDAHNNTINTFNNFDANIKYHLKIIKKLLKWT